VTLSGQFKNLPTPTVADTFTDNLKSSQQKEGSMHSVNLSQAVHRMPTLRASDGYERRNRKTMERIARDGGDMTMPTLAATTQDWGRFKEVVQKWENTIGIPAPAPTKPDGKDGGARLSSEFTEWMMGLPKGWITGLGLSRKDELKACGNGVVPQQAKLALKLLLDKAIL
jgi:DNA (cytosine-5)-methyltransferase 1